MYDMYTTVRYMISYTKYEISEILDSQIDKWHRCKLLYLVKWAGYKKTDEETSWLPASKLGHASKVILDFHQAYPSKPGPLPLAESWSSYSLQTISKKNNYYSYLPKFHPCHFHPLVPPTPPSPLCLTPCLPPQSTSLAPPRLSPSSPWPPFSSPSWRPTSPPTQPCIHRTSSSSSCGGRPQASKGPGQWAMSWVFSLPLGWPSHWSLASLKLVPPQFWWNIRSCCFCMAGMRYLFTISTTLILSDTLTYLFPPHPTHIWWPCECTSHTLVFGAPCLSCTPLFHFQTIQCPHSLTLLWADY